MKGPVTGPVVGPASRPVLAIETATRHAIVAVGSPDGALLAEERWDAGHRHAEELLARIASLLERAGIGRPATCSLGGIVVGTGPGGYTGLRVGLATARGLARAAGVPLVGIPTGRALEAAARSAGVVPADVPVAVALPAGRTGSYLVRDGVARLAASSDVGLEEREGAAGVLVAVDLDGRAAAKALSRGAVAVDGLAAALLALGCARLRAGEDDSTTLAPEYVTLPRGVTGVVGEVAWSPARP